MRLKWAMAALAVVVVTLAGVLVWRKPATMAPATMAVVVGVEDARLFLDLGAAEVGKTDLSDRALAVGTEVSVTGVVHDSLHVKTESGEQGWLARGAVCSPHELERRQSRNEVPDNLFRMHRSDSGVFTTSVGGADFRGMPVGPGTATVKGIAEIYTGAAVYLDDSMKGETAVFMGTEIMGDPSVIWLLVGQERAVPLPVWVGDQVQPGI